ncbi:TetR/AcrR family transcriptional regulator C-terminal domain-containing protein [Nocardia sp. NPDC051570]|uniref:TetR/AcrR family transcriptional regulator C-terminal domain-containing protein n=1 Tax=Nocardia sp. NPDC051570 TaxID=3364324 RepID=UPI0037BBD425
MDRDRVVEAGLALLDEVGLDGLTMRKVAERLGVQLNTVYWHVSGKPQLLEAMSDRILAGCADEPLPDDWRDRVRLLAHRIRHAMLAHRDGGRVVAGRYVIGSHTLAFGDKMVGAFLQAGYPPKEAAWITWTIGYYIFGLVQEEQAAPEADTSAMTAAADPARYPSMAATLPYHHPTDFDERFEFGLTMMLTGLPAKIR